MIILAFLLPLAIYLLIVGSLNNRDHPVMVAGPWDFAGILFGASGFLLFGGPAILSNFSERGRLFWMLGEGQGTGAGSDLTFQFTVFLSALYFVLIVAGAAYLLLRQRAYTSIYNVDAGVLARALHQACLQAGASPLRSGNLLLFGMTGASAAGRRPPDNGIQTAPFAGSSDAQQAGGPAKATIGQLMQSAVLEVDTFAWLHHATLRWDPADIALRVEVERELRAILNETPPPDYVVSFWATLLAQALFVLIFLGALLVLILRML